MKLSERRKDEIYTILHKYIPRWAGTEGRREYLNQIISEIENIK